MEAVPALSSGYRPRILERLVRQALVRPRSSASLALVQESKDDAADVQMMEAGAHREDQSNPPRIRATSVRVTKSVVGRSFRNAAPPRASLPRRMDSPRVAAGQQTDRVFARAHESLSTRVDLQVALRQRVYELRSVGFVKCLEMRPECAKPSSADADILASSSVQIARNCSGLASMKSVQAGPRMLNVSGQRRFHSSRRLRLRVMHLSRGPVVAA
jgi:hypothetical protein